MAIVIDLDLGNLVAPLPLLFSTGADAAIHLALLGRRPTGSVVARVGVSFSYITSRRKKIACFALGQAVLVLVSAFPFVLSSSELLKTLPEYIPPPKGAGGPAGLWVGKFFQRYL